MSKTKQHKKPYPAGSKKAEELKKRWEQGLTSGELLLRMIKKGSGK